MDAETLKYYNTHAFELALNYNSSTPGYIDFLKDFFPAGGRILDIGCGSGRDLHLLKALNYQVKGIEASVSMREEAIKHYPDLKGDIFSGRFPSDFPLEKEKWDGVLMAAVLQHISSCRLFETLLSVQQILKKGGRLIISVPIEYPGITENEEGGSRDSKGRLFILRSGEEYLHLLGRIGFIPLVRVRGNDAMVRNGISWETLVLKKRTKAKT